MIPTCVHCQDPVDWRVAFGMQWFPSSGPDVEPDAMLWSPLSGIYCRGRGLRQLHEAAPEDES